MATELKRRAVICEIHGIRYDPELTSGCVRCRREGLLPRSRPRFIPLLLALLAFTLIAARLVKAILEDRGEAQIAAVVETADADVRLDPRRYRDRIERVESSLYPTSATDPAVLADRTSRAGTALAADLDAGGHGESADAIRALATDILGTEVDARAIARLRNSWFDLRGRIFLPADWMHNLSEEAGDPALVGAYIDYLNRLSALIDAGDSFGVDAQWQSDLESLESQAPPAPAFGADSALVLSYRAMQRGLDALRRVGGDSKGAASAFADARSELDESRNRLSSLG